MTARYKPYPEYKSSDVEWLGDVPRHWTILKTSYCFKIAMGQTILNGDLIENGSHPVFSATEGDHYFGRINHPTVKLSEGDLVIPARGNSIGHVKIVYEPSTTTQTTIYCKNIAPDRISGGFAYYYMGGCRRNLFYFTQTAIPQITVEEVGSNPLTLPPPSEQRAISAFLDRETGKIDRMIGKQERMIELLKEKRQAVISHAVTKGLDPNVPMKGSGVEWLGEIPEHWSVSQIGQCAFVTKLTGFEYTKLWQTEDEGEIIALRGLNIKNRVLELKKIERISTELSKKMPRSKLNKGDIVFPCTGTIGNAARIESSDKYHINQNVAKIRFEQSISSRFAVYWLTSTTIREMIAKNDMSGMQPVVLIGDIRKLPIPRLSIKEQDEICTLLDKKLIHLSSLTAKAEQAIELMKERRTALISAAVTGKIDVRTEVE